jgi:branched-chain amino acid transport system ATP-binding protein
LLNVEHITSGYGKKQVITNISLDVKDNEIVLLTGGNGSGKSTVLRCIYGLLKPWNCNGKIIFEGTNITGYTTSNLIRLGLVYIPQKNNYFEELTIDENLEVSGTIYNSYIIRDRKSDVYNEINRLKVLKNRTPFSLSGGERQLLTLGMALMHKPILILFDEPFAGLDSENAEIMKEKILKLNKSGIKFLIVEHKSEYFFISKKIIKMELGKIVT